MLLCAANAHASAPAVNVGIHKYYVYARLVRAITTFLPCTTSSSRDDSVFAGLL